MGTGQVVVSTAHWQSRHFATRKRVQYGHESDDHWSAACGRHLEIAPGEFLARAKPDRERLSDPPGARPDDDG